MRTLPTIRTYLELSKYQATHFNPDRGKRWPGECEAALDEYGGFWGPFLK